MSVQIPSIVLPMRMYRTDRVGLYLLCGAQGRARQEPAPTATRLSSRSRPVRRLGCHV